MSLCSLHSNLQLFYIPNSSYSRIFRNNFEKIPNFDDVFVFLNRAFDFGNMVVREYCNHDFIVHCRCLQ